jgi:hypothetical protein
VGRADLEWPLSRKCAPPTLWVMYENRNISRVKEKIHTAWLIKTLSQEKNSLTRNTPTC